MGTKAGNAVSHGVKGTAGTAGTAGGKAARNPKAITAGRQGSSVGGRTRMNAGASVVKKGGK